MVFNVSNANSNFAVVFFNFFTFLTDFDYMNCYSHIFILFQNPKNLYITEKSGLFFFYEKPNRSAGQAHVSESLKLS